MVCKIWQHLTRNNKQTKVNSWHSFGIKHCNKITASELLNYSSQIDISKTVSWKFTETGEIIAIFSYCQHLRISIYTRWHTHTHTPVNLETTCPLPFPCNTMTNERMTEYCVTQRSFKQGHITKKDQHIPYRRFAANF